MTKTMTDELAELNPKRIFLGGIAEAVILVAVTLLPTLLVTHLLQYLGFTEQMVYIAGNTSMGIGLLAFLLAHKDAILGLLRGESDGADDWHTTEEIAIKATGTRRRHYYKQIVKTAGGIFFGVLGAVDAIAMIAMHARLAPTFQEAFGSKAALNYKILLGCMVLFAFIGIGIAVRSWRNRYQAEDAAIIAAMEELEEKD